MYTSQHYFINFDNSFCPENCNFISFVVILIVTKMSYKFVLCNSECLWIIYIISPYWTSFKWLLFQKYFSKIFNFIFHVCGCLACMFVGASCICLVPMEVNLSLYLWNFIIFMRIIGHTISTKSHIQYLRMLVLYKWNCLCCYLIFSWKLLSFPCR